MDRRTYLTVVGAGSVAGLTGLAGCTDGGGDDAGVIPGTAPGFRPFEFREDGELVGFDIDLLEAVADEAELTLGEWETTEFDTLIPSLQNEDIDVIAAAMTTTEDRDETIDFTDPYYNADQAVLVREDGDFQPSSFDDLEGRPVGAQSGTTGEGEIQGANWYDESNYNSYGSYVLAVEDLENGNIDAIVIDTPVANTFADDRPVEVALTVETGERYGFGIREDDDDLQSALNDGLETVMNDGTYEDITSEWFGE
jgi:polar amino acid transport system substrate-binding protein